MDFGLWDWLSPPSNNPNEYCQCWSVKCKRLTLLMVLFPFTLLLALISLLLWTRFGFALPVVIIGIVTILQVLSLLISVPAFFDEKKFKYLLPSLWSNAIATVVWIVLLIIYIVKIAINHFNGTGGQPSNVSRSIYLPGIPSYGFGNTATEGLTENEKNIHYLGHVFFMLPIQLFLAYLIYGIYRIFKTRNTENYNVRKVRESRPPHNIAILEQNVDDGIYGVRDEKFNQGRP
uniref:Uncharacterized protein n=1 Tax=Panagrolaimus sp. ES5 TaxID=591445 RepID=A0AC34FQE3_9BILA